MVCKGERGAGGVSEVGRARSSGALLTDMRPWASTLSELRGREGQGPT